MRPCAPCRREKGGKREHRLRVYAEIIWPHEALEGAGGMSNRNRSCMPFPFKGEVPAEDAQSDFYVIVDGFKRAGLYETGAARGRLRSACQPACWRRVCTFN